jgi:hypothetical protein
MAGKEILKVNPQLNVISLIAGGHDREEPLLREVDALYALASGKASSELDNAMRLLDQL